MGSGFARRSSQDAPFAAAIGACILNSLVFPAPDGPDDEAESGGAVDATDARFVVMGVISFIPYFNWLGWVFAWLDSGRRRYLVYSIVYLAPYLRTNLSISPEDSWLPISSILLCIIHVQLEASIRNGDIEGIPLLDEVLKFLSAKKKESHFQGHQRTLRKVYYL
ncbi:hypothetical protein QJS04_geneDACA006987 [Acorus gramineus]|uniref:Uncharacterized protein n=1 Tax=Acorus gramineus TaxID=55184 RepID=A0AAV9A2K0_ACOGR|nr:hypothetical protein QJS04_geneDACA006987 [Acorus gramineus]